MTNGQIKNLGFSIFLGVAILYVLLFNFSWISLASGVICISFIFMFSLLSAKDDGIIIKLDLYTLFFFMALLSTQYEKLVSTFSYSSINYFVTANSTVRITTFTIASLAGLIMLGLSKKCKSYQGKTIVNYIGLFLMFESFTYFLFGSTKGLAQNIAIFTFFGIIKFCKHQYYDTSDKTSSRSEWIAVLISIIMILLYTLFPEYRVTEINLKGFFSVNVFPWFNILGITLICASIGGAYMYFGKKKNAFFDEDMLFLSGFIGFIWVFKTSLYFYIDYHWIAVCLYSCFFLAFISRFFNRRKKNKKSKNLSFTSIKDNESYLIIITAFAFSVAIYLTNIGYIAFWLSLLISTIAICFIQNNFHGWVKNAVFWQSIIVGISVSGGLFSLQNGYSEKKVIVISAIFVFTSFILWVLNHKNHIGNNKFKKTKIAIAIIFGILVFTAMGKAGTNIDVFYTNSRANGGSFIKEDTTISLNAKAKGKNNEIKELKYIWARSFFINEDDAILINETETELTLQNRHLVIWATDSNGVVTRTDRWFYKAP